MLTNAIAQHNTNAMFLYMEVEIDSNVNNTLYTVTNIYTKGLAYKAYVNHFKNTNVIKIAIYNKHSKQVIRSIVSTSQYNVAQCLTLTKAMLTTNITAFEGSKQHS